jgi:hypothetical protein
MIGALLRGLFGRRATVAPTVHPALAAGASHSTVERPAQPERPVRVERPVQVGRPVQADRPVQVERPVQAERPPEILPIRLDEALARLRAENPARSEELPSEASG